MSFTFAPRAIDGIKLLGGSPVTPLTGVPRLRPAAKPRVPLVVVNGAFVPATVALPGFPRVRLPRAYVDPGAIGRESKPANFRRSCKRMRRKLRRELAEYGKKRLPLALSSAL